MNNLNNLESAIQAFHSSYVLQKSDNVYIAGDIDSATLAEHKYLKLEKDEKPLLLINGKKSLLAKLTPFSGFVMTNKNIHFSLLKRSFFTSLYPFREKPRSLPLNAVQLFQIGEHDSCFGTAYVGHDLRVNNQVLGLVRLGWSVEYDESALSYLNHLVTHLYEKGFFTEEPQDFGWQ